MIVVADTSPLIALSAIEQDALLGRLFSEIQIPPAVRRELNIRQDELHRAKLLAAPWLVQRSPTNIALVNSLRQNLGAGEAEAIALAVEMQASLIIMDERLGRRTAARFALPTIGVLGLLVAAKDHGIISAVGPLIEQLHHDAGFRLSHALIQRVLADCGEFAP